MRWDHLFDDLEGQLERELHREDADLAAEEERLRLGRLDVRQRLVNVHEASRGTAYRLELALAGGRRVTVAPTSYGRDWMLGTLVDDPREVPCIVPLPAVDSLSLTPGQVRDSLAVRVSESPTIADRLGLSFVLRDLCRRRRYVQVESGQTAARGTIDRVGRDHLDLAVHEPPRRASSVSDFRLVSFASITLVTLVRVG